MEFNADQNVAFPSGDVGIGTGSPALPLDISGIMRAIDDAAGCTATERGAIRFNSAGAALEVCDGGTWGGVGDGGAIDDLSDGISDGSSVFLGANAGVNDDGTSNNNTAVGINALNAMTTGWSNTSIGAEALMSFTSSGSTAVGYQAAKNVAGGNDNVAVGSNALKGAVGSTGGSNTAVGKMTLHSNDTGWNNVAVGIYSLQNNTTGANNVIVGSWAGRNNTTGSYNVAFGESVLINNTTGYGNTAIGNFAMGSQASVPNGDMDANTAIGYHAGLKIEGGAAGAGGNSNTLLGYEAGSTITTGDRNIMIGRNAQPTSATVSNELNIGDTLYGDLSAGNVGIGAATPQSKLDVNGEVQVGNSGASCTASNEGAQRYNSTQKIMQYCDGSNWCPFAGCDTAPDAFAFTDLTNQPLSTTVESDIVQITGVNVPVDASISGDASAEYRICDDSNCTSVDHTWSSTAGSIDDSQYLQLRLTTSSSYETTNSATVSVGTGGDQWNVTTESAEKTVFVTSTSYQGQINIGGVAGADNECQVRANNAGLSGTYKAWISDSNLKTPANDFTQSTNNYVLVDGTVVANGWSDLTDGTLDNAISMDENGTTPSSTFVWTATTASGNYTGGSANAESCDNWTNGTSGALGIAGWSGATSSAWTNDFDDGCEAPYRLYCFEQ